MVKSTLTCILLTFLLIGCQSQPKIEVKKDDAVSSANQVAIDKFWKWFQLNEKSLRNFESDPDKVLTEVLDSAREIQSGLAIEFEPPVNNIINVTISADGDRNLFPVVKEIVAKAPKVQGWSFVAFRQRMPADQVKGMTMKAQDFVLDPSKMKFSPVISGDSLDLIIYTSNVTEANYLQVAYRGLTLIDNILGEYDCVIKVRNYDFQNMPAKSEGLKPLLELTEYVDNFHKAKTK